MDDERDITRLLEKWEGGEPRALERLTPEIYRDLHRIATGQLLRESAAGSLQPTALVNELFLYLLSRRSVHWRNRDHFFGFAAQQMRRILIDRARYSRAAKRGSGAAPVSLEERLEEQRLAGPDDTEEQRRLHAALSDLARFNPDGCRVVFLRFFGGLRHAEIASLLGVSTSTARNKWRAAKLWLQRELRTSAAERDLETS